MDCRRFRWTGTSGDNGLPPLSWHCQSCSSGSSDPSKRSGHDGPPAPCPGRPLRLLALLLVDGVRVTPADVAIDALWGEALPAHPANALQLVVSRLRARAGRGGDPRGGRRATSCGSPAPTPSTRAGSSAWPPRGATRSRAATAPRRAGCWPTRSRSGAARRCRTSRYEPFAAAEAARLEELRLTCLGERIEADLALGRHAELVGELQALVAEHPLREPLRAQLMLALYRGGRQADALAAYRDARRVLADELGLDPSPELRALERDILRHRVGPLAAAGAAAAAGARSSASRLDVLASERGAPLDPEVLRDVLERCHDAMERGRAAPRRPCVASCAATA